MRWMAAICVAAAVGMSGCTPAADTATEAAPGTEMVAVVTREQLIARGQYIVEGVGMCSDCHTPRLADGTLDMTKLLTGAPTGSTPLAPQPWAPLTPAIAGLPKGYSEEQLTTLLTTGVAADGFPPLPPMPPYRMNFEDATSVAAYLASLPKPG